MTYLLDTQVWLWMLARPERFRAETVAVLQDTANRLLLSATSSWEIAIKCSIGRLALPQSPDVYVPDRMRRAGVSGLPVEHVHALGVSDLPMHHRDPFDRLLIAQAQVEDLPIITADQVFEHYDVEVFHAQ